MSPTDWYQFKLFLAQFSGFDRDMLHVFAGIFLQLAIALILHTSVTRWTPWLAVLAMEIANEWSDFQVDIWPNPGMQYGAAAKDILLTMLVPTVIMLISRHRPQLLVGDDFAKRED